MDSVFKVVYSHLPGQAEVSLSKLARFSGIHSELVDFPALMSSPHRDMPCLALTARTLAEIDSFAMLPEFKRLIRQHISHLLITGVTPCLEQNQTIQAFTDGSIVSVTRARGRMRPYSISKRFREITGPLTGLSISPVSDDDAVFIPADDDTTMEEIISIGGMGHFIKTRMNVCNTYLLGCADVVDIDKPVSASLSIRNHFSSLFPILMFIRQVFGRQCWHSPRSQATLTIDDPLLVERYGYVHYQELLQLMDRYNFFTTIAFIPWNFRRTSPSTARLLNKRKDRLSICVHGCDHTRHELASTDHGELNGRVKLATIRMIEHQRLTNIPFDRIMVFPQSAFSSSCMEVLRANNFLAAVNLETNPIHPFEAVPLRSFLEPAITCFGNFPLFQRRYPEEVPDLALDLFLYKPALILEHHDFFQRRSSTAMRLIRRINDLDSTLRWGALEAIVTRSYLQKQEGEEMISLKAFSRRTSVSNDADRQKQYTFLKEEKDSRSIDTVMVNGKERSYEHKDSLLTLSLSLKPGSTAEIEIVYRDTYPHTQVADTFYQNLKVFSRRHLSEIRDNYLSRNRAALAVANKMKNLFA